MSFNSLEVIKESSHRMTTGTEIVVTCSVMYLLSFANNSLAQCRITMKFLHIFLNYELFLVHILRLLRGSDWAKWSKLSNFCFCSKSVLRYGGITSQIFRGLAALEPHKVGG